MINQEYVRLLERHGKEVITKKSIRYPHPDIFSDHIPGYFPAHILDKETYPFVLNPSLTRSDGKIRGTITNLFAATDSKDLFETNLQTKRQDWPYHTKQVRYDVNKHGYRTDEFSTIDWANSIPVFGCSCVYGIGLAYEDTISGKIETKTGNKSVNMGFPSGSNELILINILNMLDYIPISAFPKNIVIGWTCIDRCVYFDRDIIHCGSWTLADTGAEETPAKRYAMATNEEVLTPIMKNFYIAETARNLLRDKTNLIEFSYFPDTAKYMRCSLPMRDVPWDRARDDLHPGINCSDIVSDYVIGKIK